METGQEGTRWAPREGGSFSGRGNPSPALTGLRSGPLQVEPFASLCEAVRRSVPRLLINREVVGPFAWRPRVQDVVEQGDVVEGVQRLVELLGWTEEMQDLIQREAGKVWLATLLWTGQVRAMGHWAALTQGGLPADRPHSFWLSLVVVATERWAVESCAH